MELGGVGVKIKYVSFFITPTSSPFGATPPGEENYPYPRLFSRTPFPGKGEPPAPFHGAPLYKRGTSLSGIFAQKTGASVFATALSRLDAPALTTYTGHLN